MPLTSDELRARRQNRLQSIYESVEQGVPVDWERNALLHDVEQVQMAQAVVNESVERNRKFDEDAAEAIRKSI